MEKKITMSQAIQTIVEQLDGPITEEELARRVFEIYSTTAKTARSSLRNALRYDHDGRILVWFSKDKIIPMHTFMSGIRFRIPVDPRLAHACILTLDMFEPYYASVRGSEPSLTFLDEKGGALPVRMKSVKLSAPKDLARIIGNYDSEGYDLQNWAEAHRNLQRRQHSCHHPRLGKKHFLFGA